MRHISKSIVVKDPGENHALTIFYLHIAQWVSEFALSVPNDNASDAFLSPRVLSTLRVAPVGVSILFREDFSL